VFFFIHFDILFILNKRDPQTHTNAVSLPF
jgi:hypothetical protein